MENCYTAIRPLNIIADGMSRLVNSNKCPVAHGFSHLREISLDVFVYLMREINAYSVEEETPFVDVQAHNLNILKGVHSATQRERVNSKSS